MKQVTELLQNEARMNPVFNAVATMFAVRKRTRYIVTLRNLKIAMDNNGFKYGTKEYAKVLEFLGQLGLGVVTKDRRGGVKALDRITTTLQSIGMVALGYSKVSLKTRRQVRRFKPLEAIEDMHTKDFVVNTKDETPIPRLKVKVREESPYPTYLTVMIEGRPVFIQGPADIKQDNLGEFMVAFKKFKQDLDI